MFLHRNGKWISTFSKKEASFDDNLLFEGVFLKESIDIRDDIFSFFYKDKEFLNYLKNYCQAIDGVFFNIQEVLFLLQKNIPGNIFQEIKEFILFRHNIETHYGDCNCGKKKAELLKIYEPDTIGGLYGSKILTEEINICFDCFFNSSLKKYVNLYTNYKPLSVYYLNKNNRIFEKDGKKYIFTAVVRSFSKETALLDITNNYLSLTVEELKNIYNGIEIFDSELWNFTSVIIADKSTNVE